MFKDYLKKIILLTEQALEGQIDEMMEMYCVPEECRAYMLEGIATGHFAERLEEVIDEHHDP